MRINTPLFYRDGIVLVQYFNYAKWSPELTWFIIVVWALHVLKVGLHFFFFQTLLIWSTFFHKAKIPQQKSCPEVEYCCVLNWPDLLRHFFFFANAQMHRVPHALFMQQVITTLNKRIFLYILPDLQLYTYMQKFLNLCDHIYTYTWNIHNKKD